MSLLQISRPHPSIDTETPRYRFYGYCGPSVQFTQFNVVTLNQTLVVTLTEWQPLTIESMVMSSDLLSVAYLTIDHIKRLTSFSVITYLTLSDSIQDNFYPRDMFD